jgi:hypothetical protein
MLLQFLYVSFTLISNVRARSVSLCHAIMSHEYLLHIHALMQANCVEGMERSKYSDDHSGILCVSTTICRMYTDGSSQSR